jgi:hypothetical protein
MDLKAWGVAVGSFQQKHHRPRAQARNTSLGSFDDFHTPHQHQPPHLALHNRRFAPQPLASQWVRSAQPSHGCAHDFGFVRAP